MADELDLTTVGGIKAVQAGGDPNDPADEFWNFGIMGQPGLDDVVSPQIVSNAPNLYDVAPHIQGRWDGKTSICCHDAARKVLGNFLVAQMQPRGTCGGRTAKRATEHLQTILVAAGRKAKFHKVSHAWPYALARMEYGMLGGGDGVPDGGVPPVMAKYGMLNIEEANETSDYGQGSDDLAIQWGRNGPPKALFQQASDNKIDTNLVKVRTFSEYADGIAAGGVGLCSSNRGFTMQRDAKGRCAPSGRWAHYMCHSGVAVIEGRPHSTIDQSWGKGTPSGPQIEDGRWPDWSFAADWEVVESDMIKAGSMHVIFGFHLWDESAVIDWSDI